MHKSNWMKWSQWLWVALLSIGLALGVCAGIAAAPPAPEMPDAQPLAPQARYDSHFEVLYMAEGQMDNAQNVCHTWNPGAQTAFDYALNFWADLLVTPTVHITIKACWADLTTGQFLLEPVWVKRYGAPSPGLDSWYPAPLANTLPGAPYVEDYQLNITYNRNVPWHYDTAITPPGDKYDFASAVMRQIAHGLGFRGFMRVQNNLGYWQFTDYDPAVYDRFVQNSAGQVLFSYYVSGSPLLAQQLQSNDLYFNGYSAGVANGGTPPKLYAPATWEVNTSYIHLDTTYYGTAEGLMAPPRLGEAYHDVGPVILGILRDVGWYFTRNTPPLITGLPDQVLPMNGELSPMIDLWNYAADAESADDAMLEFDVIGGIPLNPGVSIYNTHYLSISLQNGWEGYADITIQVSDPDSATDTDVFRVTALNTPPTLAGIPEVRAPMNIPYTQVLDLRRYASDAEDSKNLLSFDIISAPNPNVTVSVSQNRFLDIYPGPDYIGSAAITARVTDSGGQMAQDTFTVTVTDENLPPILQISNKSVYIHSSLTIDLKTLDWDGANDYARDPEGQPLTITLRNAPAAYAGVDVDGVRYIKIIPTGDGIGTTQVQIRVEDPEGAIADDSFNVRIWDYRYLFMPLITRDFYDGEGR